MAVENVVLAYSFSVSGNGLSLATDQFKFVQITTSKRVLPGTAGCRVLGVAQGTARPGKAVGVAFSGSVSKVRVGAVSLKAGVFIGSDATGLAAPARGGCPVGGQVLEDGVSGEIVSALLLNGSL